MSKKLARQNLNVVMAGILAAALLGGCGSQPRERSGVLSSSSPAQLAASESAIPLRPSGTGSEGHTEFPH